MGSVNVWMMMYGDKGWINDENPIEKAARTAADKNFQTPLDEVRRRPRAATLVSVLCFKTDVVQHGLTCGECCVSCEIKIDAAARIVDPIFSHVNQKTRTVQGQAHKLPAYGVFLKDYFVTEW